MSEDSSPDNLMGIMMAISAIAGISAIGLGCCVLFLWFLQTTGVFPVPSALLSVSPLAGLLFIVAGVSLRAACEERPLLRRIHRGCAIFLCLVATFVLLRHFGWDLGIEPSPSPRDFKSLLLAPRISHGAVLTFFLAGWALVTLDVEMKNGIRPAQFLSVGGLAVALMTLASYGYGIHPILLGRPASDLLELNAALSFAVLNLGILCVRPDRGLMALASSQGPGGETVRHLLPALIIVPTGLAWVRIGVQQSGLYKTESGSALFALANIAFFIGLIWWNATLLQKANAERSRAEKKVQEAAEMKAEFAAMVSHELRTPLTSIKLGIDMVMEGPESLTEESHRHYLGISKRNVDRLARLINEVLDFQKLEMGKQEFHMEAQNINALISEIAQTFTPVVTEKGLELALSLTEGLPAVVCDRDKISQVVVNLVNNAVKFSQRGKVTILTEIQGGLVRVAVQDQGPGIRPEDQGKLFQSFSQLRSSGKKNEGSGLGLAISREIIEQHGGKIGVQSAEGQGSVFYFLLPRSKSEEL